ncbi:MAG: hypothetical protein AAF548_08470 [Actinomycetota bacterium]
MPTHHVTRQIASIAVLTAAVFGALLVGVVATSAATNEETPVDSVEFDVVTEVGDEAVATFTHHAPEVDRAPWCDVMAANHDDWEGFRTEIAGQADAWATDEVGMLAQVGVAMAATCPADVHAFVDSLD